MSPFEADDNADELQRIIERLFVDDEPALLYHRRGVRTEVERLNEDLKIAAGGRMSYGLRYAVKANANPLLLRWFASLGLGAEVASKAEFVTAQAAAMEPIAATSPGFTSKDVEELYRCGVEVNIDNVNQLGNLPPRARIGLRVCVPQTPTGLRRSELSRFGVDLGDDNLYRALTKRNLEVVRLHAHLRNVATADDLVGLVRIIVDAVGRFPRICAVSLGGGMTRLYRNPGAARDAWRRCVPLLAKLNKGTTLLVEPGAQLLTRHGYLGARVVSSVERSDGRQLVTLVVSRWNLVAWSDCEIVFPTQGSDGMPTDVVGPTCYENDVWAADERLPRLGPGDLVVLRGLGAYVSSMARCMHGLPIPQEVLL